MMMSFDLATSDRREMLLDKDRLHAIGLQHEPSWATGNLLRDMQTPPKVAKPAHGPSSADPSSGADPLAGPKPQSGDGGVGPRTTAAPKAGAEA
jgi:hypothetical protein